jgi:hypothetical protein
MDLREELPSVVSSGPLEVVVCMRDTVLCLPDRRDVASLVERVATSLAPKGTFVLTYRDLTQPLHGVDRFLPARSDEDRIMLCALDYEAETVTVSDLVYTRDTTAWELHKSSYQKLRLSPDWLSEQLVAAGLNITHHSPAASGMWSTVATKTT